MIYYINDARSISVLTDGLVESLWKTYLPNNALVVFNNGSNYKDLGIENITQNYPQISCVIFDCAVNAVDISQTLDMVNELNLSKPHYLITSNFNYYKQDTSGKIKFFPFWLVWTSNPTESTYTSTNGFGNLIDIHRFSNLPKLHLISCLNGTPNEHRKLSYLILKSKSYFDEMVFTFGNRAPHYCLNNLLTAEENKQFKLLPQNVSHTVDDKTCGIDISIDHPAFLETYINLVTETSIDENINLLSEKTFKPIVAGQLFILVAAPGAIKFLRDIGIDTFDDIIDHTYDTIIDSRLRIKTATDQLDQLMKLDLADLYATIKPRLIKNSTYFLSDVCRQQFSINI